MSDGVSTGEAATRDTLWVLVVWLVGVICVAVAGGWVGARYAAALGAEVGGLPHLAGGVLLVSVHLPAGALAYTAGNRGAVPAQGVLLAALLINAVGMVLLVCVSPAPRCLETWQGATIGWIVVWSLTTASWIWRSRKRRDGWMRRGGLIVFLAGCLASVWLYALGPYALLPADVGGGRPVEQSVIINGGRFEGDVVHLGDGWRVVIASDCVVLGGRVPTPPVVLERPAGPVATLDTPARSH